MRPVHSTIAAWGSYVHTARGSVEDAGRHVPASAQSDLVDNNGMPTRGGEPIVAAGRELRDLLRELSLRGPGVQAEEGKTQLAEMVVQLRREACGGGNGTFRLHR